MILAQLLFTVLTLGNVSGTSTAFDLPVTLSSSAPVCAAQFDVILPPGVTYGGFVAAGTAASSAAKTAEAALVDGTNLRVLVYGMNQNVIGSGGLATVRLNVAAGTAGRKDIGVTHIFLSSPDGNDVPGTGEAGSYTVLAGTPNPSPRPTEFATLAACSSAYRVLDGKYGANVRIAAGYLRQLKECQAK